MNKLYAIIALAFIINAVVVTANITVLIEALKQAKAESACINKAISNGHERSKIITTAGTCSLT